MSRPFFHLGFCPLLSASGLSVFRGERLVFRGVGFSLNRGGILLLRGANGAGKSSLLRAVAGLSPLASGELLWGGENALADLPGHAARIAWLGHLDAVKLALNVAEHAPVEALRKVGLEAYAHLPSRLLSAGQKRRLAIARVVAADRPLWLLDEPTTGLDAASVAQFCALCRGHVEAGGMILASTHLDLDLPAEVLAL